MAETVTFRPNIDTYEDLQVLLAWCEHNGSSFNSVINSLLPAIAYTVQNQMIELPDGTRHLRCDFGDVLLREPNYTRTH